MHLHVADLRQRIDMVEDRLEKIRHVLIEMLKKPEKNEEKSYFPVF